MSDFWKRLDDAETFSDQWRMLLAEAKRLESENAALTAKVAEYEREIECPFCGGARRVWPRDDSEHCYGCGQSWDDCCFEDIE